MMIAPNQANSQYAPVNAKRKKTPAEEAIQRELQQGSSPQPVQATPPGQTFPSLPGPMKGPQPTQGIPPGQTFPSDGGTKFPQPTQGIPPGQEFPGAPKLPMKNPNAPQGVSWSRDAQGNWVSAPWQQQNMGPQPIQAIPPGQTFPTTGGPKGPQPVQAIPPGQEFPSGSPVKGKGGFAQRPIDPNQAITNAVRPEAIQDYLAPAGAVMSGAGFEQYNRAQPGAMTNNIQDYLNDPSDPGAAVGEENPGTPPEEDLNPATPTGQRNLVKTWYRNYLGREASDAEVEDHLRTNPQGIGGIEAAIKDSQEAKEFANRPTEEVTQPVDPWQEGTGNLPTSQPEAGNNGGGEQQPIDPNQPTTQPVGNPNPAPTYNPPSGGGGQSGAPTVDFGPVAAPEGYNAQFGTYAPTAAPQFTQAQVPGVTIPSGQVGSQAPQATWGQIGDTSGRMTAETEAGLRGLIGSELYGSQQISQMKEQQKESALAMQKQLLAQQGQAAASRGLSGPTDATTRAANDATLAQLLSSYRNVDMNAAEKNRAALENALSMSGQFQSNTANQALGRETLSAEQAAQKAGYDLDRWKSMTAAEQTAALQKTQAEQIAGQFGLQANQQNNANALSGAQLAAQQNQFGANLNLQQQQALIQQALGQGGLNLQAQGMNQQTALTNAQLQSQYMNQMIQQALGQGQIDLSRWQTQGGWDLSREQMAQQERMGNASLGQSASQFDQTQDYRYNQMNQDYMQQLINQWLGM